MHYHRLIAASQNNFDGLLIPGLEPTKENPLTLSVHQPSDILNIILHCVYVMPCDNYHPPFERLAASLPVFEEYGLLLPHYLSRGTPLHDTVLNYAPFRSIDTYTLAASHGLEDLAVEASSYTLDVKVYDLPTYITDNMGTKYLQRLHHMHASRKDGLREILNEKIFPHEEKPYCSVAQRQVLSEAYHLAGARVFYDATPGEQPVLLDRAKRY